MLKFIGNDFWLGTLQITFGIFFGLLLTLSALYVTLSLYYLVFFSDSRPPL